MVHHLNVNHTNLQRVHRQKYQGILIHLHLTNLGFLDQIWSQDPAFHKLLILNCLWI
jgi:hypothetical protein